MLLNSHANQSFQPTYLGQVLGCNDKVSSLAGAHGGMVGVTKYSHANIIDYLII